MDIELINDIQEFYRKTGAMDELAERGYDYPEMYGHGYIEYLSTACEKYGVRFNKEDIDFEKCDEILEAQNHLDNLFTEYMGGWIYG